MTESPAERDRQLIRALAALPADDVVRVFGRLDALAAMDPPLLAEELVRAGDEAADAIVSGLSLGAAWPRTAASLSAAEPRLRPVIVRHSRYAMPAEELWRLATPSAVVAAAGQDWADDMLVEVFARDWPEPDGRRWRLLTMVLDVADDGVRERMTDLLSATEWACADPWPVIAPFVDEVGRRRPVPGQAFLRPYRELFPPDESRVVRARAEVDLVLGGGPVSGRWWEQLGRSLPGCGFAGCCRPGLFEAELLDRGIAARRWLS